MLPAVSFRPQLQRSLTSDVVPLVFGIHLDFDSPSGDGTAYQPVGEVALGVIRIYREEKPGGAQ